MVLSWLKARGPVLPDEKALSLYPPIGFVADRKAASFLYLTNSAQGFIDNTTADPFASREDRALALRAVIQAVCDEAKARGLLCLQTWTAHPTLVALGTDLGFVAGDDMRHLIRKV
jgi:hypothetical protein